MSAPASEAPIAARAPGSGRPSAATASDSEGPTQNSAASQGIAASGSASSTAAVKGPRTARAASVSHRYRALNSGSAARGSRTVLTTTTWPAGERARWAVPVPLSPS